MVAANQRARRHLEEALSLARQAERPYLEISCLAHLGIAGPDGGGSVLDGVHYAEQAIARAEALGWGEEAIITPALAISGVGLMWLGRFDEAERRLDRADRALRPEEDPMTTLIVRWATGLLRLIQGRLEEALALAEAQRLSSPMGKEVRTIEPRGVMLQTQVRMGRSPKRAPSSQSSTKTSATALSSGSPPPRSTSRRRIPKRRSKCWPL